MDTAERTRPTAGAGPTDPAAGDRAQVRRALLISPAAITGAAAVIVAVLSGVLDSHHLAAVVSALVGSLVVVFASAITGALGVRTATARAEAVFAVAMVSFLTKVLVFAIALAVIGSVGSARRLPFAAGAIVAVLVWLAVEVWAVSRLRSTGAAVFGPPKRPVETGVAPPADGVAGPAAGTDSPAVGTDGPAAGGAAGGGAVSDGTAGSGRL